MSNTQPIYLLADSQPLFTKNTANEYYLSSVHSHINKPNIKASYIGWSNHNRPEFYDLFVEGMKNLNIHDCHMISEEYTEVDQRALIQADLILLAGGDVTVGFEKMAETGVIDILREKYAAGTILIGISAGAIQLGWQIPFATDGECEEMMKLVPYIIAAHDEANQWSDLKNIVLKSGKTGIGIPFGGGFKYYPDQRVEIINKDKKVFYWTPNGDH